MKTIHYYEKNTEEFILRTINVDMKKIQEEFLKYLPENADILDLGCGSGRDSRAFLDAGYKVVAVDGSEAMCKAASAVIQKPVRHLLFEQLDYNNEFDGIWACASLLHVPSSQILDILNSVVKAVKPGGYIYFSVKYGSFEGERDGRYFTDYTDDTMKKILKKLPVKIIDLWLSEDERIDRSDHFLNAIIQKNIMLNIDQNDN